MRRQSLFKRRELIMESGPSGNTENTKIKAELMGRPPIHFKISINQVFPKETLNIAKEYHL